MDDMFINEILVIGNGFDLANNYETRYSDFIEFINNDEIEEYKNSNYYHEFKKIVSSNRFISYFQQIDFKLWADMENELHRIIDSIRCVYSNKNNIEFIYDDIDRTGTTNVKVKIESPIAIKALKSFNLIKPFRHSTYLMPKEYFDYYNGIKWKELNYYLSNELYFFKKALILYLREFVPLIYSKQSKKIDDLTKEQLVRINPTHIISFNYTNYYRDLYECKNINRIHGNLEDEKVVLGYEDELSSELEFVRFKKYFQRIQYKLKPIEILDGKRISETNIIYFYGLSFDYTDEDYIRKLFKIEANKRIIYYLDDEDYDNKVINLLNIFKKDYIINELYLNKIEFVKIERTTISN